MKGIKYQLLGIGLLLFAICVLIFALSENDTAYFCISMAIQMLGLVMLIIGFLKEDSKE